VLKMLETFFDFLRERPVASLSRSRSHSNP
jgi:hypothetical protein